MQNVVSCLYLCKGSFSQLPGPDITGSPRESWRSVVQSHLTELNITSSWFILVSDRLAWRQLTEAVPVRT